MRWGSVETTTGGQDFAADLLQVQLRSTAGAISDCCFVLELIAAGDEAAGDDLRLVGVDGAD